jgi:DNA-binding response OmpR family regulator
MKTILIVDDQPDTLSILNKILINEGYTVRTALTVDVALKSALKSMPDLRKKGDVYDFMLFFKRNHFN